MAQSRILNVGGDMQRSAIRLALWTTASAAAMCVSVASPAFAQATGQDSSAQQDVNATQGAPSTQGTVPGTVGAGSTQMPASAGAPQANAEGSVSGTTLSGANAGSQPAAGEIVVTGIRQSLANAQAIKRNSDTVVDAITAEDIGALPDRSVSEALQRVPGVDINHFAGGNDPDHFSVEGSGVTIRGLNFVRPEFNGRDVFEASGGSGISFADIPPELVGNVRVYKNITAEMIEGGLAGTVDIEERLPLDNKGFHVGFDGELNYSDFVKKTTPVGSVLVSNTWETGMGTFGILAEGSYSQLKSRSDGMKVSNFQTRDGQLATQADSTATICRTNLPDGSTDVIKIPSPHDPCRASELDASGHPVGVGDTTPGSDGIADDASLRYAPIGASFDTQKYDRVRKSAAAALQWESLDRRALLTFQFTHADSDSKWNEKTFETAGDLSEYNTYPVGCTTGGASSLTATYANCPIGAYQDYQYDSNDVFEKGFITLPGAGWRASDSGSAGARVPVGGTQQSLSTRYVDDRNIINDFGLNFKFNPTDHWAFNVDGQYTHARHDNADVSVYGSTFADEELDLTGSIPQAIQHKPLTLKPGWGAPVAPYLANDTDEQYFNDKSAYFWRAAMDHFAQDSGHEYALKADAAYDFKGDIPFLKRIKFGARYADRLENINETAYNWGAISEIWSGTPVWMDEAGSSSVSNYNWNNFFRGKANAPAGGFYYNQNLITDYNAASTLFDHLNDVWHTTNGATATNRWLPAADRPGVVPGTEFLPGEMQVTSEHIWDFYGMLTFGTDEPFMGDMKLSGNVGVRHMQNRLSANGSITFPTAANSIGTDFGTTCAPKTLPSPPYAPGTIAVPTGICTLGPDFFSDAVAFFNGASSTQPNAINKYNYWLPSLNLRLDLTNKLLLRFAASKVLAFPDIGYTRNFETFGSDNTNGFRFLVNAGNPYIKPARAWTFDLTAEWYFAKVGSLTAGVFEKSIKGFFYSQTVSGSVTNNGVTENVDFREPQNYDGTGKVRGAEVSYQQTFDFLPGLLSGFGVNANFTYLKSKGLPNSFLTDTPDSPVNVPPTGRGSLPLEGLSKYTYNVQGFYEKGPLSVRAAWSWRSKNLQTASDTIFPYFPIYNGAYGTLDATIFFNITKQVKIGVQGTNLTDSIDKTYQQFTTTGLLGPRSAFIQDRQFAFIVRGNF